MWFGLMVIGFVGAAAASTVRYVDAFDLSGASCGLGLRTRARQSVGGYPLTVGGKVYGFHGVWYAEQNSAGLNE